MKVATKVIEGLADKSKFINNVKVSGTYLEAKTEDKDDVFNIMGGALTGDITDIMMYMG